MSNPRCGWLLLDKPPGLSSAQALNRVKRLLDADKAGHAGTLDPAASGLLLIALGEACKFLSLLDFAAKRYRFSLHWGRSTTTDDNEGSLLATHPYRPNRRHIEEGVEHFLGSYNQSPPAFSALKINGQRAYKRARQGELTPLAPRPVAVHDFRLLTHHPSAEYSRLTVCLGKGGYVRALGRDLAQYLGTFGHVRNIRRSHIGDCCLADAISLASLEQVRDNARGECAIRTLEFVLDGIPALDLTFVAQQRLLFGQRCALEDHHLVKSTTGLPECPPEQTLLLRHGGHVFGYGTIHNGFVHPKRLMAADNIPQPDTGNTQK